MGMRLNLFCYQIQHIVKTIFHFKRKKIINSGFLKKYKILMMMMMASLL